MLNTSPRCTTITAAEDHRRIAGGMGRAEMHQVDALPIEMKLHGVVEGDRRQAQISE